MRILIFNNKKINLYLSIFIICFVLSFFVPWYTISEKRDFSGHVEEYYYNYKLTGFEIINIHYFDDEKNKETVQTFNNENGMARTAFFINFGIIFFIFGLLFIISHFVVTNKPKKQSKFMKLIPLFLILIFIGGYLLAYQADYNSTEYKWDDLYIENLGFFGYGERFGIRGYGIDSSGECETTMSWYPNIGFVLLLIIASTTLLIHRSIKQSKNQLQTKVVYITFKLFKWKFKNDLQFRIKFYSICLIIFLLLSLMLPWFTIRNRYHEEDYSYYEDYIYTINYYLYRYEWDSNYHGRPYTSYEPYSNFKFQQNDLGEKYFTDELKYISNFMIIICFIGLLITLLIFLKKSNLKIIYPLQLLLAIFILFILVYYLFYTDNALNKDNKEYYAYDRESYPKGDINHIPIDSLYGYETYENEDQTYSDTSVWYPGPGFYTLLIALLFNFLLMNQFKIKVKKRFNIFMTLFPYCIISPVIFSVILLFSTLVINIQHFSFFLILGIIISIVISLFFINRYINKNRIELEKKFSLKYDDLIEQDKSGKFNQQSYKSAYKTFSMFNKIIIISLEIGIILICTSFFIEPLIRNFPFFIGLIFIISSPIIYYLNRINTEIKFGIPVDVLINNKKSEALINE